MAPSHFVYLIMALSATLIMATMNKSTLEERKGRVFSLFSIVQFPNDACRSTSGTYSNGTCYTSGECSSKGGSAQGNCAAGFGVCCTFSVSATSSRVSENCTYIVNPNYPRWVICTRGLTNPRILLVTLPYNAWGSNMTKTF